VQSLKLKVTLNYVLPMTYALPTTRHAWCSSSVRGTARSEGTNAAVRAGGDTVPPHLAKDRRSAGGRQATPPRGQFDAIELSSLEDGTLAQGVRIEAWSSVRRSRRVRRLARILSGCGNRRQSCADQGIARDCIDSDGCGKDSEEQFKPYEGSPKKLGIL
jgi:hypothetical protein